MIVRRWLSIFWRAAWSMRASCMRSSSRILRTSRRMVLRSSMKSTSSSSATASVTAWASLLTLSRLNRTAKNSSKNSLVFFHQLGLYLTEHFLVIGAALLHFLGIGFEDDAHLVVDAVFERQFFEQRGVHLLVKSRHRLGLNETARHQFFGNFAGQIAHIFFGKEHVQGAFLVKKKFNTSEPVVGRWSLVVRHPPQLASTGRTQHFAERVCQRPQTTDLRPSSPQAVAVTAAKPYNDGTPCLHLQTT